MISPQRKERMLKVLDEVINVLDDCNNFSAEQKLEDFKREFIEILDTVEGDKK